MRNCNVTDNRTFLEASCLFHAVRDFRFPSGQFFPSVCHQVQRAEEVTWGHVTILALSSSFNLEERGGGCQSRNTGWEWEAAEAVALRKPKGLKTIQTRGKHREWFYFENVLRTLEHSLKWLEEPQGVACVHGSEVTFFGAGLPVLVVVKCGVTSHLDRRRGGEAVLLAV